MITPAPNRYPRILEKCAATEKQSDVRMSTEGSFDNVEPKEKLLYINKKQIFTWV